MVYDFSTPGFSLFLEPYFVLTVKPPNCDIVCLAGITSGGRSLTVDFAALNRSMVLENDVVFGTVNANRRHYEAGAAALNHANRDWLARLQAVVEGFWSGAFAFRVGRPGWDAVAARTAVAARR